MADQIANNALDMSDEDFMNAAPSTFEGEASDDNKVDDNDPDEATGSADDDANAGDQQNDPPNTDDDPGEGENNDDDPNTGDDPSGADNADGDDPNDGAGDLKDPADQDGPDAGDPNQDAGTRSDDKQQQQAAPTDDKAFAEIGRQVMSEFKANGQTIKVKSAEDAITLMQMGANYHKKMAGLKPALKNLKLLENHGLMDPAKLNFLIDLSQKKPEAIKQLLKDSNLDAMELDLQDDETYVPKNRVVNDNEILLDEVLDSISHTPHYQRTLKVVADDWDEKSRDTLATDPTKIRVINQHMERGIFDQVIAAVNYERSLGKLAGVSDYDAYVQIGHRMHTNNEFVVANQGVPQNPAPESQDSQQSQRQSNTATDAERNKRKAAASPNRQKGGGEKKVEYDPLAMSDEEFARVNNLKL